MYFAELLQLETKTNADHSYSIFNVDKIFKRYFLGQYVEVQNSAM